MYIHYCRSTHPAPREKLHFRECDSAQNINRINTKIRLEVGSAKISTVIGNHNFFRKRTCENVTPKKFKIAIEMTGHPGYPGTQLSL